MLTYLPRHARDNRGEAAHLAREGSRGEEVGGALGEGPVHLRRWEKARGKAMEGGRRGEKEVKEKARAKARENSEGEGQGEGEGEGEGREGRRWKVSEGQRPPLFSRRHVKHCKACLHACMAFNMPSYISRYPPLTTSLHDCRRGPS